MGGAKADEAKALKLQTEAAKAGLPLGAYNASVLAKDEKESTGLLLGAMRAGYHRQPGLDRRGEAVLRSSSRRRVV
ncbi:MAG: hypothetical protein R3F11_03440 [Verrucomicrobiales bacterium]